MGGQIVIQQLEFRGRCGVTPEERARLAEYYRQLLERRKDRGMRPLALLLAFVGCASSAPKRLLVSVIATAGIPASRQSDFSRGIGIAPSESEYAECT